MPKSKFGHKNSKVPLFLMCSVNRLFNIIIRKADKRGPRPHQGTPKVKSAISPGPPCILNEQT